MLYVTTRDDKDAYTVYRALTEEVAPDNGRFIPFRLPQLSTVEIHAMKDKSFGQVVAEILNVFFTSKLNGWDVDFNIGRNVLKLVPMHHRILVAELWHNLGTDYQYIINSLYKTVLNTDEQEVKPTEWFKITVRIAVLFGIYAELLKAKIVSEDDVFDISVSASDFTEPMAAWYAKQMGLPIGIIICADHDSGCVWDVIQRGAFNPSAADDGVISGMERLIHATLGLQETLKYLERASAGQTYSINADQLKHLNKVFFCSVVGKSRANTLINSIFRTNSYIVDPNTAVYYGALQDYRAKTGESRMTLFFAEHTPDQYTTQICNATGISKDKLKQYINHS